MTKLVRATGAREVVKVKSMVTQEIELNEALERAGIAAIETDLAELIVQLGHDKPSHILVPAIHKNRSEIRDIFINEMPGVDSGLSDEPRDLAMAARKHLREKFLTAKVAISGANFAVADSGTLCVVESEGNGRMCLTLPETLISVVGIEKLVPTWADLEVYLQLLPRSSTGERMNPYTSLWTGAHGGDGPTDVHVILLDNGRSAVLADEIGRQTLNCIRCSACLNVCPVYERTGGHAYGSVYPGPIGAILSPLLTGVEVESHAAVRVVTLRCLLRRVPGEDQHPRGAGPPARQGGRRQAGEAGADPGTARDAGDGLDLRRPEAVRSGAAVGVVGQCAARARQRHDHRVAAAALGLDLGSGRAGRASRELP